MAWLLSTNLGVRSPARPGARCGRGGGGVDEGLWGYGLVVPWPPWADWEAVAKPRGVVRSRRGRRSLCWLVASCCGRSRRPSSRRRAQTTNPKINAPQNDGKAGVLCKTAWAKMLGSFGLLLGSTTPPNPRQMMVMCEREQRAEARTRQRAKPHYGPAASYSTRTQECANDQSGPGARREQKRASLCRSLEHWSIGASVNQPAQNRCIDSTDSID